MRDAVGLEVPVPALVCATRHFQREPSPYRAPVIDHVGVLMAQSAGVVVASEVQVVPS